MSITNNKVRAWMKPLLFGGLIVAAPLAVGSVHFAVVLGLLLLSLIYWFGESNSSKDGALPVSVPVTAFGLFALTCTLQLIPVPAVFHKLIDPRGWQLYVDGAALLGQAPGELAWRPLSLAPAATADRALRWLALGVWALVAADFARRKGAWHFTLRATVAAGLIHLVVGLIQMSLGNAAILFFYEPTAGAVEGFTTFVNLNHAAVFYGLVSLAAFALCIHTYHRDRKESTIAALLGVAFMIAMTEHDSQGASLAYWMSLAVMGFALVVRARPAYRLGDFVDEHFFSLATLTVLAIPAAVAALWWWGPVGLRTWLEAREFGLWLQGKMQVRVEMARAAVEGALAHPGLGAGAGAIETALRPFIDWDIVPAATIPTVENEPTEWLFGFGFPVAIAGMLLLALFFPIVVAHYKTRRRNRLLAVFALGVFLLVNAQFHFPFFTLGLGLPFVALLVVGLHTGASQRASKTCALLRRVFVQLGHRPMRALLIVATVGAVGFSLLHYVAFAVDEGENASIDLQRLTPADGSLYARAAYAALGEGDKKQAIELIEFAYRHDPRMPVEIARARLLIRAEQPLRGIEAYRNIFANQLPQRVRLRRRVLRQMVADIAHADHRASALRDGTHSDWSQAFRIIRKREGVPAAIVFALALSELHPNSYDVLRLIIRGYNDQKQYLLAEFTIRQFLARNDLETNTSSSTGYGLLLNVLFKQGRRDKAYELVVSHVDILGRDRGFWQSSVGRLQGVGKEPGPDFTSALQEAYSQWCRGALDEQSRVYCWRAEAWLAEQRGKLQEVEWALWRIYDQTGRPDLLVGFYLRHFLCKKIEALMRDWQDEHVGTDERRSWFEGKIRSCQRKLR
jgi:tetratricopeptide (TPR) repeat protein